jgi:hypothetical protein
VGEERTRTRKHPAPPKTWTSRQTDEAVKVLKDALSGVGITLPTVERAYGELTMPLVDLGRARPDVVVELASCLTELVELRQLAKALLEGPQEEKETVDG